MASTIKSFDEQSILKIFVIKTDKNPNAQGKVFTIDDVNNPELILARNGVYIFDQSDISNRVNREHQIIFKDSTGAYFTNGVVTIGTPGQVGAKTVFTVPHDAPNDLAYTSQRREGLGNTISVKSYKDFINNLIEGTPNNDLLVNLAGNDQINGGDGIDTLVVSGLPSQYSFNGNTLTGVDGVDTLTSIEFIRFGASLGNDLFVSDLMPSQLVDPDGNGPRLSPVNELIKSFSVLYIAYFNRSPDIEGLMYWFKELNSGNQTLSQVSAGFTQSPEYSAAYPAGSSNREFITQIYKNLFDRAPDAAGLNFWENTLNAGSPRDVFINTVINGAYAPTGGAGDRALLDNKHAVSLHYTEQLSSFPTKSFDIGISTVLNRVTNNPATVNQGLAVIDHVMDNPITLTGLINDAQAFDAFW